MMAEDGSSIGNSNSYPASTAHSTSTTSSKQDEESKMKRWIRRWLGLDEILDQLQAIRYENRGQYEAITNRLGHVANRLATVEPGLARIIAKIDPMYGKSEFDPARVAESKKLEDGIINKLLAEYMISNRIPK